MKNLILLPLALLLAFSCNQHDEFDKPEKQELLNSLTFKKIDNSQSKDGVNVVIFSVDIARPSQNCQSGWGFCNFEWFPLVNGDNSGYETEKQSDYVGDYFEIHFANQIPPGLTDEDLKMIVENTLSTTTDQGVFIINAGEYEVDRNLGEFGGYRIYLN